ncbi:MAG: nucleotidyltransferase domain-containing protein [Kofleriaceae bacterium]
MSTDPWRVLTEKQRTVARAFLAARDAERTHLVVYLSGAHAYGFPSPDSDLDLKCVHVAPTRDLVGLTPPPDSAGDRIEVIDGVELDYGSNELGPVLRGAIKGNGNFLERILGELALGASDLLASAREVVKPLLSRRCAKHYGGFATSQLKLFDEKPSAKRALYVLRTAATGRCVLARGEVITDVAALRDFVPPEIDELIAIKQQGERTQLDAAQVATWRERLVAAIAAIDAAWPTSVLPPDAPDSAIAAVDAWLREVRRAHW